MKVSKIDIFDSNFSTLLYDSLANTGFAIISNHGIKKELLDSFYAEWTKFFYDDIKFAYIAENGSQAGYFPMKSENAKGYSAKDLKEFYHVFGPYFNEVPSDAASTTIELAFDLQNLGIYLLTKINYEYLKREDKDLNLVSMVLNSENTLFRILHYPPLDLDYVGEAVRAAPHEDINLITLLPAATAPGLSVKDNDGKWYLLDVDEGTIVVNVGDMLQEATNGKLRSTTHRVLNPTGFGATVSRYSAPLFMHPHPETRLSEKYTAGEYLEERLQEIGLIKEKQ